MDKYKGLSDHRHHGSRHRLLVLLALVVMAPVVARAALWLMSFVMPLSAYEPGCWPSPGVRVPLKSFEMAADYRALIIESFDAYGIANKEVDGVLLYRAMPFIDGDDVFSAEDALLNSENKLVYALASKILSEPDAASYQGYIYRYPDRLRAMTVTAKDRLASFESYCREASKYGSKGDGYESQFQRCMTNQTIFEVMTDCNYVRAVIDAKYWRPATAEELARRTGPLGATPQ